jgi:hypothetical protein
VARRHRAGPVLERLGDVVVDGRASVRTQLLGTAPNRSFVAEWRDVTLPGETDRLTFEVIFAKKRSDRGSTTACSTATPAGNSATVGLERAARTLAAQFSRNEVAWCGQRQRHCGRHRRPTCRRHGHLAPGGASTTTAADGGYQFTAVPGRRVHRGRLHWRSAVRRSVRRTVLRYTGATTDVDLLLMADGDEFGNTCVERPPAVRGGGPDVLARCPGDATQQISTPFPVRMYGGAVDRRLGRHKRGGVPSPSRRAQQRGKAQRPGLGYHRHHVPVRQRAADHDPARGGRHEHIARQRPADHLDDLVGQRGSRWPTSRA